MFIKLKENNSAFPSNMQDSVLLFHACFIENPLLAQTFNDAFVLLRVLIAVY